MRPQEVVHSDPEIMGGVPVFVGTRVPFKTLFEHLEDGATLEEFLHSFPTVEREQAVAAIQIACDAVIALADSDRRVAAG